MKLNLLLLVLALACTSVARAQTEKGTKNLGFSFGYSTEKNSFGGSGQKQKRTDFDIGPTFSYFIADRLDLGASLGYFRIEQDYQGSNSYSNGSSMDQVGASVFLRKHIMLSDQFGIRTGPFAAFTTGESTQDNANEVDYTVKSKSFSGGLNLGIEYFPTKRIGIAANLVSLSYGHSRSEQQGTQQVTKVNSFNLNVTNGLNLSIFLVFGGNSK